MENSAQAKVTFFILAFVGICAREHLALAQATLDNKIAVKEGLFKNRDGHLFVEVGNFVYHPSKWGHPREKYLYTSMVYVEGRGECQAREVVDTETFKIVDQTRHHFIDRNYTYVSGVRTSGGALRAYERRHTRFLGKNKVFLVHKDTLYYGGDAVEGAEEIADTRKLSAITYPRSGGGFYDFVTDGKRVWFSEYLLNAKRLSDPYYDNLGQKYKRALITRFSLK